MKTKEKIVVDEMMVREIVEYAIITAFIKNDEFAKFTVDEIVNTSWGQEVMFSEYWRDEELRDTLFEDNDFGRMRYYGTPFTPSIDRDVFIMENLIAIDFTLSGTTECKVVVDKNKKSFRMIVNSDEILNNEKFDEARLKYNKF